MTCALTLSEAVAAFRALARHPRASRDQLIEYRNARLRRVVTHAYRHVPYYRRLFDRCGLTPDDVRTVEDLPRIPMTSKRDLQALPPADLIARGVRPARLRAFLTGGSTGEPFTIRRTWLEERVCVAVRLRALRAFGLSLRSRRAIVGEFGAARPGRLRRALGLWPWTAIDGLQPPADVLRALERLAPDAVLGYPGVLSAVARVVLDGDGAAPRPRFVATSGEALTPRMRTEIGAAFHAPVVELYGSHEFRTIAWQCRKTGHLHVADDHVAVEVLQGGRPAGPGEAGELVGTALHSLAMPFIRYRLGDVVTRGTAPCACGQPFSTIRSVQGRMVDYLTLPGGRLLHPYRLITPGEHRPWVRQLQVFQEREDRVVLRVVPGRRPTPDERAEAEREARAHLGPGVEFELILVSEIPLEPGGKFRYCRSLVRSVYDDLDWERAVPPEPRPDNPSRL